MLLNNYAFDDFLDDCFIDGDPLCVLKQEKSSELLASQIISEPVAVKDQNIASY